MSVIIENNIDSPKIVLDEEKSIFLIEGSSYMADAYKAYKIVLDWINDKFAKCENHVVCQFKFSMLSSASRKMVFEILSAINQNSSGNKDVQIHWYYSDYDEDMKEIGEVYAEQIQLPFSFFTM